MQSCVRRTRLRKIIGKIQIMYFWQCSSWRSILKKYSKWIFMKKWLFLHKYCLHRVELKKQTYADGEALGYSAAGSTWIAELKQKSSVNSCGSCSSHRVKLQWALIQEWDRLQVKPIQKKFTQMFIWSKQQRLLDTNLFSISLCFSFLNIYMKYFRHSFFLT